MIDHKASTEAFLKQASTEAFLKQASNGEWPASVSLAYSALARVHATLHLAEQQAKAVEQQRVANLIATARMILDHKNKDFCGNLEGWVQDSEDNIHSLMADEDFWVSLMGEVRYEREKESWKHD